MRQNPHVRICGGPGSATTLVYPTPRGCRESTARPQQRGGWALTAYLGTLLVFQASKRARLRVLRANSSVVDTSPCSEVYVPAFGKRTSVTARSAQRQVPA